MNITHDNAINETTHATPAAPEIFTFDDTPDGVISRESFVDYFEMFNNGRWYEPPTSYDTLAKLLDASPHHSSALYCKRNILATTYIPHPMLDVQSFMAMAMDFLVFGTAHIEERRSRTRQLVGLRHSPAYHTRIGVEPGTAFFVKNIATPHEFERGSLISIRDPHVRQEIYGVPQYLAAVQALLLSDAATVFRRRYYVNGAHAGFILYISDALHNKEDVDAIKQALKDAKGKGNFRNFFIYSPTGKPDGVKIIPISEISAKDDFSAVKKVSRDDILAAHRVPPQLLGIIPDNTGGFGKPADAAAVFVANELVPLQLLFRQINAIVGMPVVTFSPYSIGGDTTSAA